MESSGVVAGAGSGQQVLKVKNQFQRCIVFTELIFNLKCVLAWFFEGFWSLGGGLGGVWEALGGSLEGSGGGLERPWQALGHLYCILDASWERLGGFGEAFRGQFGASCRDLGAFR